MGESSVFLTLRYELTRRQAAKTDFATQVMTLQHPETDCILKVKIKGLEAQSLEDTMLRMPDSHSY
jgi:hypothetical protein